MVAFPDGSLAGSLAGLHDEERMWLTTTNHQTSKNLAGIILVEFGKIHLKLGWQF